MDNTDEANSMPTTNKLRTRTRRAKKMQKRIKIKNVHTSI